MSTMANLMKLRNGMILILTADTLDHNIRSV